MAKILIVEDYADLLEFLIVILRQRGHEAEGMLDGRLMHEKIKLFAPNIILMDVKLGMVNGRDLCREIKAGKLNSAVQVILISASPEMLKNYAECEASAVIEKPFEIETLFETINKVLVDNNQPLIPDVSAA